jgi:hypothetical protein
MKVLAKRVVCIVDAHDEWDTDLELRIIKNEYDEYVIKAFYFGRYISEDIYSGYESDFESAHHTMIAEADWHEMNPDVIGNTDKFDIRCSV